jgi:hypothetical protein
MRECNYSINSQLTIEKLPRTALFLNEFLRRDKQKF